MKPLIDIIRDITPEQIATIAVRHKWCHISIYPCEKNCDCFACWLKFLNSKAEGYSQWLSVNQR